MWLHPSSRSLTSAPGWSLGLFLSKCSLGWLQPCTFPLELWWTPTDWARSVQSWWEMSKYREITPRRFKNTCNLRTKHDRFSNLQFEHSSINFKSLDQEMPKRDDSHLRRIFCVGGGGYVQFLPQMCYSGRLTPLSWDSMWNWEMALVWTRLSPVNRVIHITTCNPLNPRPLDSLRLQSLALLSVFLHWNTKSDRLCHFLKCDPCSEMSPAWPGTFGPHLSGIPLRSLQNLALPSSFFLSLSPKAPWENWDAPAALPNPAFLGFNSDWKVRNLSHVDDNINLANLPLFQLHH